MLTEQMTRAQAAGPAERRPQPGRARDGAVRAGQGDAQLGQGGQAGLQAPPVEPGPGRRRQLLDGRRQAEHRQQLGQAEGAPVEGTQGGGQRRGRARPAGQLGERGRRGQAPEVGPALEQALQLGVGEAGKGGRITRQRVLLGMGVEVWRLASTR